MFRTLFFSALAILCLSFAGVSPLSAQETPETETSAEQFEKEFAEKMTGVTLIGYFTVDGQQKPPKEERYDIYDPGKKDRLMMLRMTLTVVSYCASTGSGD